MDDAMQQRKGGVFPYQTPPSPRPFFVDILFTARQCRLALGSNLPPSLGLDSWLNPADPPTKVKSI